jgi:hypothetical protein
MLILRNYCEMNGFLTGIGFACKRLEIHDKANIPDFLRNTAAKNVGENDLQINLIPTAIGSTSLEEWAPGYLPGLGASSGLTFTTTPNANATYHEGCPNILSCAMRSLFLALMSIQPASDSGGSSVATKKVRVHGILWYQGENDATLPPEKAGSYGERFSSFLQEVRWIVSVIESVVNFLRRYEREHERVGLEIMHGEVSGAEDHWGLDDFPEFTSRTAPHPLVHPPIVTTAITSTRPWLRELSSIRQQQLASANRANGIAVVDAFGLILKPDCIHLTGDSALIIGERMALEMIALQRRAGASEEKEAQELWNHHYLNGERTFLEARSHVAVGLTHSVDTTESRSSSSTGENDVVMPPKPCAPRAATVVENIRRSGLKFVNFTYGEVCFLDFCRLLSLANRPSRRALQLRTGTTTVRPPERSRSCKFVDLGCGAGCTVAAAISTSGQPGFPTFTHVVGIDMLRTKVDECKALVSHILGSQSAHFTSLMERTPMDLPEVKRQQGEKDRPIAAPTDTDTVTVHSTRLTVDIVEANFLEVDWSDAAVVYACATCFDESLLFAMTRKLCLLAVGTRVILIDALVLSGKSKDGSPLAFPAPPRHNGSADGVNGPHAPGAESNDNSSYLLRIEDTFEMLGSCQVNCTWGTAFAFVYEKVK